MNEETAGPEPEATGNESFLQKRREEMANWTPEQIAAEEERVEQQRAQGAELAAADEQRAEQQRERNAETDRETDALIADQEARGITGPGEPMPDRES